MFSGLIGRLASKAKGLAKKLVILGIIGLAGVLIFFLGNRFFLKTAQKSPETALHSQGVVSYVSQKRSLCRMPGGRFERYRRGFQGQAVRGVPTSLVITLDVKDAGEALMVLRKLPLPLSVVLDPDSPEAAAHSVRFRRMGFEVIGLLRMDFLRAEAGASQEKGFLSDQQPPTKPISDVLKKLPAAIGLTYQKPNSLLTDFQTVKQLLYETCRRNVFFLDRGDVIFSQAFPAGEEVGADVLGVDIHAENALQLGKALHILGGRKLRAGRKGVVVAIPFHVFKNKDKRRDFLKTLRSRRAQLVPLSYQIILNDTGQGKNIGHSHYQDPNKMIQALAAQKKKESTAPEKDPPQSPQSAAQSGGHIVPHHKNLGATVLLTPAEQ